MLELHSLPHHDGSALYAPRRDAQLHEDFVVRVRVPAAFGEVVSVMVRVITDGEARFHRLTAVAVDEDTQDGWWEGSFELANPITRYRFLINRADGTALWLTADGVDALEPVDSRDFRVTTFPRAPEWATSQVMYQIFPDRFARSRHADGRELPPWAEPAAWSDDVISAGPATPRQFFGGDLDGVIDRLEHLDRLGVTIIYLTPFFPATSNHRYDASSFARVDPLLGGDQALIRLVEAAHARGIRVIGDLTTNHTGDAHEWFVAAKEDPDAPESAFYYWTDQDHTEYEAWYGVPSLPKLNWNSDELRRRFIAGGDSVVGRWLRPPFNLDGWRVDVANMTGRLGADDLNRQVQRDVRRTIDEASPGSVLYAESTNDSTADFDGDGWQAPMSYSAFTRPLWQWLRRPSVRPVHHFGIPYETEPRYSAADLVDTYRRFTAPFPWSVREMAMNAIDTHDTPRFAHRADEATQVVAAGLSMTLPGTPVIFAGDEFGLHGESGEAARQPIPWGRESALASVYSRLSALRRNSSALQRGGLRWLHADEECLIFLRELVGESVLVFASRSSASAQLPAAMVPSPTSELNFGSATLELDGDVVRIASEGPTFAAWTLARTTRAQEPGGRRPRS